MSQNLPLDLMITTSISLMFLEAHIVLVENLWHITLLLPIWIGQEMVDLFNLTVELMNYFSLMFKINLKSKVEPLN